MAAVGGSGRMTEIARRIARKTGRSHETIRMTLKTYDREHPERAIFPAASSPLDDDAKTQIYKHYRRGVSVEVLTKQYGRTRSSVYRIINEMRARRILETKLEYMPHPDFEIKARHTEILGPMPVPADGKAPRKSKAPKGLPPYLASLYEVPLLSREQEGHLFRKMNFLKFRAAALREGLDPTRARTNDLDEIERLQEEALAVKNQIIRANLRLVVSIAKRHVGPTNNFFELVSDGNMSLIRAVEKFDASRGNKFSTYASWAIMKNFARTIPEENYRRDRFVTGHEEMFEAAADNRTDEHEYESAVKRMQEAVKKMLGRLDDREQRIIISRYGLGGVQRANARTARPRAGHHQGARPADRVPRPGEAPQDRRRGEARTAHALSHPDRNARPAHSPIGPVRDARSRTGPIRVGVTGLEGISGRVPLAVPRPAPVRCSPPGTETTSFRSRPDRDGPGTHRPIPSHAVAIAEGADRPTLEAPGKTGALMAQSPCILGGWRYSKEFHGLLVAGVAQSAEQRFCKP